MAFCLGFRDTGFRVQISAFVVLELGFWVGLFGAK